jgi:hypothetical protein
VKPSVSATSTADPMVIPLGLPSGAPPSEEPQGKNQSVSKSSGTLGSQGVSTQVLSKSEAPRLSPF